MKAPKYIIPIAACDDCREIMLKSNMVCRTDKYMFRNHYVCRKCNRGDIASRYWHSKALVTAIEMQRENAKLMDKILSAGYNPGNR